MYVINNIVFIILSTTVQTQRSETTLSDCQFLYPIRFLDSGQNDYYYPYLLISFIGFQQVMYYAYLSTMFPVEN